MVKQLQKREGLLRTGNAVVTALPFATVDKIALLSGAGLLIQAISSAWGFSGNSG